MQYLVIFEKAPDGTIWARVPDLDGCFSSGDTIDEAKVNVKDAIALYLKDLKDENKPIPQPSLLKAELVSI
ncbi:MAG: type II toxin-antitoxin system HicB family antitoxin [Ginsengibacter sp.]|jgi:predicted RNase H-like HicB family nuclease